MSQFKHGDLVKIIGPRYGAIENNLILEKDGQLFIVGSVLYSDLEFEKNLEIINPITGASNLNKLEDMLKSYELVKTGEYSNIQEFDFLKNLGHSISPCGEMIYFHNLDYEYPIDFKKIGKFIFLSNSDDSIPYDAFCYLKHLLQCPLIAHLPLEEEYEDIVDYYEEIGFKLIDSYLNENSGNQVNVYVFN